MEGIETNGCEGLTAEQIWEKLYNKELTTKKNILEYIDIIKRVEKENISDEQIQDTYNYISGCIDALKGSIKPNTMMFLKNNLKAQLGKYVKAKDTKQANNFVEFFKKAYPENARRREFTWTLMDINNVSEDQIWTTLVYINRECLKNNISLNEKQKEDIVDIIEKSIKKNNLRYINNVKTLKQLTDILQISIVNDGKGFIVKRNKKSTL